MPFANARFVLVDSDRRQTEAEPFASQLVPYKERPAERAFLNIVSIIAKVSRNGWRGTVERSAYVLRRSVPLGRASTLDRADS